MTDLELLARLVFAEGTSTGFADSAECRDLGPSIFQAIAWGVMNRVRLAEVSASAAKRYGRGVRGVIFKPGQFNPAISGHSRFAKLFACPSGDAAAFTHWETARAAARTATGDPSENPFLLTDWEKRHRLSLVTYFYYPKSPLATATPPAWADTRSGSRTWVRNPRVGGRELGEQCIWFFRRESPPAPGPRGG
jgi:hypothetical protein